MSTRYERILSANMKGGKSPTGMHAGGRGSGLGPAAERMSTVINRANRQGITLIGGEEVSGVQVRRVIERHSLWMPIVATPNDEWPNGATLGNVLFLHRPSWVLDEHAEIEVPTSFGSLHFVDAILRHCGTSRQLRAIVGHQPAGRRTPAQRARSQCEADVRMAIKGERLPVALLFDFNTPHAFRGWDGARHKVDAALVRGLPTSKPRVHAGFNRPGPRKVSDHAGVSVRIDLARPW